MTLPVVMREETIGFRQFKTYWQGQVVTSAIFKGKFYQQVQQFSEGTRLIGYQNAVQLALKYEVLITVSGSNKTGQVYTVWANRWDCGSIQETNSQVATQQL
ncbi:MAG: hypothetical protein VKJ64_05945 [Leptolyngbyaceae bacterium]|nr:hypothetical protein [Leptolyngbyaceae bacterium]